MDITDARGAAHRRASRAEIGGDRLPPPQLLPAAAAAVATANPLAASAAQQRPAGDAGSAAASDATFRRRLRRRTLVGDVGFTTFTSGIRAGWYVELGSVKFRQVRP